MPTSSAYLVTPVLSFVSWLNPRSVLDVGCGYGQWGVLLRQHLDYPWELRDGTPHWRRRIDAVEAWVQYRNPLWGMVYDQVAVADASDYVVRLAPDSYDLALCIEVLEHLSPAGGKALLEGLARAAVHVVVSTPDMPLRQDALGGNPFEMHHAWWPWGALKRAGAVGRLPASGSTVAVFSRRPAEVRPWLRGIWLRALGPLLPARARAAGQVMLHRIGLHPGPPTSGGGPSVENVR